MDAERTMRTPPSPGTLFLIRGRPNPYGAPGLEVFLFAGDVTLPIREVVPDRGVTLPGSAFPVRGQAHVHIIHWNDLHGHIAQVTSSGDHPLFSRVVSFMRRKRREAEEDPSMAVVTVTAGDDLVGTVFDELLYEESGKGPIHAAYRVYSVAGVDIAALGNHDLDMGADKLATVLRREALFPVLSANLAHCPWLQNLCFPAALLVIKGIRIGLIGLTTPAQVIHRTNGGFRILHPVETLHNLLPAIRPLCDVLIVVSHLGYSLASTSAVVEEAGDVELAQSLPAGSVHLIVGGHTHDALNEHGLSDDTIINGIPIVQAGTNGRFVGEVRLTLHPTPVVTQVRLIPTDELPVDDDFERTQVQPLVAQVRSLLAQPLGQVADHPDLLPTAVHSGLAAGESALANFITDAMVARCLAAGYPVDMAMIDASTICCGLPTGGLLTFEDAFNLMPHMDIIQICQISGAQLKDLLDDNARRADRPREPPCERGFLHFSRQLRYTIDLGRQRGEARALNVTVCGIPLDEQMGRIFRIACASFIRQTATHWERQVGDGLALVDLRSFPCQDTPLLLRREIIAYIRDHGGVTEEGGARRDGRVHFL